MMIKENPERTGFVQKLKHLGFKVREPVAKSAVAYGLVSGSLNIMTENYIWLIPSGAALAASAGLAIWCDKHPVD